MKVERPLISVVVPHLNQSDLLHECLSSLDAQTLERAKFEVIVVDNGSTHLPTAVTALHPGTRLLEEREPGPGIAQIAGCRKQPGRFSRSLMPIVGRIPIGSESLKRPLALRRITPSLGAMYRYGQAKAVAIPL